MLSATFFLFLHRKSNKTPNLQLNGVLIRETNHYFILDAIMKPNIGTADRIIRTVLAIIMAVLYFSGTERERWSPSYWFWLSVS
jgi:hypothetical protein